MKTLFAVDLSSGLPRQRVFRSHYSVFATGETAAAAGRNAIDYVNRAAKGGHLFRVEKTRPICTTPDDVCLPGALHVAA